MSSGSRKRVPSSSERASPRHTLRFAGQSMTIAPHVHPQRCWPCVFSCLLSHLCFLSASRPSHDRVSGACAAAVADFSVAAVNFFLRLRHACHWLLLSPAAGLGARLLGSFFWAASFYCTIAADQRSQAHGKGMAPEAGPRHGAAGLWVTPECAARATGHCRRRRHHRRRRRHRPSRPTHRLRPCRRSKAAPLAALATQAALRPRSMIGHPIGLSCLLSLLTAVPWCQR